MSNKKSSRITKIFDGTLDIFVILAAVLILFIALGIATDVTLRYFWSRPIFWMTEVTEYALLWLTFLVAAWLLRREGHVKMDLLVNRLKPRGQRRINITTSILSAIVCLVIAWDSAMATWESYVKGYIEWTLLEPPTTPIIVIIPIGFSLLFIQFLRRAYGYWSSGRMVQPEEPGRYQAGEEAAGNS